MAALRGGLQGGPGRGAASVGAHGGVAAGRKRRFEELCWRFEEWGGGERGSLQQEEEEEEEEEEKSER